MSAHVKGCDPKKKQTNAKPQQKHGVNVPSSALLPTVKMSEN